MSKKILIVLLGYILLPLSVQAATGDAIPKSFDVSIGGFDGPNHAVTLTAKNLSYTYHESSNKNPTPITLTIPNERWIIFKKTLEGLHAENWQKLCKNPRVMDGTQWKVHIHFDNYTVDSSGSNSFPTADGSCNNSPEISDDFKKFLNAMSELTGKKFE